MSLVLAMVMALSLVPSYAFAAGSGAALTYTHSKNEYFYRQLNENARGIYDALWTMYEKGEFLTGKADYDLTAQGGPLSTDEVAAYVKGDRTIFNDFAAAKDAFDLDHSEIWYLDSSYLSFRVAEAEGGTYHAIMGIGRTDNYFLAGDMKLGADVTSMGAQVDAALKQIIAKAQLDLQSAESKNYSDADKKAALVRSVHNSVVNALSYRFEDECKKGTDNAKYIRTLYALVTHEGVCEAYARAMQVCLTQLGVECVLVHGIQASGTPEDHMWNAVNIPDGGEARWYVVDATWDDPLTADWFGRRELVDVAKSGGVDGKENTTYLLVGQNVVGRNWLPSGNVSSGGTFEFQYPTINGSSFDGSTMFQDENGLLVKYSAGAGAMEDISAGVFTVTFQGMNAAEAREKGFYFLIKMYKTNRDGTIDQFDNWYYVDAALALLEGNKHFGDTPDGLRVETGTCDYIQVAVTTCQPKGYKTWGDPPESGTNALLNSMASHGVANQDNSTNVGYFHGTPADILGASDMLYNAESDYQAPPYVLTQTPPTNCQYVAGSSETMKVIWNDALYHPQDAEDRGPIANDREQAEVDALAPVPANNDAGETSTTQDDRAKAMDEDVRVRYKTFQPDYEFEDLMPHGLVGDVSFDSNRDGYVDDEDLTIFYKKDLCPKKDEPGHVCSWQQGCPVEGVEFKFDPSEQWADDLTVYQFYLEGVVGSKSWRTPNLAEVTVVCPSLCPYCYRSQGIDWNLWGRPRMLDNPDDLDLSKITMQGVDGEQESLEALQKNMKVDRMNGRLTLVAEDIGRGGSSRQKYEQVTKALTEEEKIPEEDILTKLMYEINFTKLCAKTMANTGDSMRIQIGYPEGFNYEAVMDGNVTFKAYHFTRCDQYLHNDCDEPLNEMGFHDWGEHIISVEEIPIVFTAYGMVVMVSSFSPFEIVGLDPSAVPADGDAGKKTIVAAFGEGGVLYRADNMKVTTGSAGMIDLQPGGSARFYVKAEPGYEVDAVTFDGREIAVDPTDDSVTISYEDIASGSCILNAAFVPAAVILADEQVGLAPTVPDTAVDGSDDVPEHLAPVRTDKVLTVGDEGMDYPTIQDAIDAIDSGAAIDEINISVDRGAADAKQDWVITLAPDDIPGTSTYGSFQIPEGLTGLTVSGSAWDDHIIDMTEDIKVLAKDVTLRGMTFRGNGHTIDAGQGMAVKDCSLEGSADAPLLVMAAKGGVLTLTGNRSSWVEIIRQGGALIGEKTSNMVVNGKDKAICLNVEASRAGENSYNIQLSDVSGRSGHWTVSETATDPEGITCPMDSLVAYVKRLAANDAADDLDLYGLTGDLSVITKWLWKELDFEVDPCKQAHEYDRDGRCTRCGEKCLHQMTAPVGEDRDPTCTENGRRAGIQCTTCGKSIKPAEMIPAIGHQYGPDGVCIHPNCGAGCPHLTTEPVDERREPTATEDGMTSGKRCTVCGKVIEEQEKIPATGQSETACKHSRTVSVGLAVEPTCTTTGMTGGRKCAECGAVLEQPVQIPALGHNYVNGTCTRCGSAETAYSPCVNGHSYNRDGICTVCGAYSPFADEGYARYHAAVAVEGRGRVEINTNTTFAGGEIMIYVYPDEGCWLGALSATAQDGSAVPTTREGDAYRLVMPTSDVTITARFVSASDPGDLVQQLPFTDVPADAAYYDSVRYMYSHGIINGTSATTFSPEQFTSRGQVVTMLWRLDGSPVASGRSFTDVPGDAYYSQAVVWASSNNIVNGVGNDRFAPNQNVTREQLAAILYRYAQYRHADVSVRIPSALSVFTDTAQISNFAMEPVRWAVASGIMTGTGGLLAPGADATRVEIAEFLYGLVNTLG